MAEPLVTVIVAVYNGETFLRESLESVFAQEYDSYEVVFVDDGSSDRTAEIARSFPVRFCYQENQGSSAARNTGLALAQGELIAFLDDDDVLPPTKLSVQTRYLLEHPDTGCVLGRQEWIVENGRALPTLPRDPVFGDLGGVAFGSVMIRRSALEEVGGFDPSYDYAEDRELFVRLREHDIQIDLQSEVVLYRRAHDSNKTLDQPANHPLVRSLRDKLDRERRRQAEESVEAEESDGQA